jgi:hypothetical protein
MRRVLVAAALVAGSLLFALAGFELLLRVLGYSAPLWYRPDPELGWRLRPGLAAWYTREGRAFVRVNAAGSRDDREYARAKPAGVYRIAVLGDSYSEAMQVPRSQTYWALLAGRLAACGFRDARPVEVLNFGVSGYGTAQEVLALESTALGYRPDLVLLQFTNGNDVRNNSRALEDEKARPFFVLRQDGLRLDASFAASPRFQQRISPAFTALRAAADYSRVVQLVREARPSRLLSSAQAAPAGAGVEQGMEPFVLAPPRDAPWEQAWRITEALISKTRDLAARNGAGFVLVTVPYAIQVHPERRQREALQAELGVPDLLYPDRRLERFAARAGIRAIALAPEMQRLAEQTGAYFHGFERSGMGRGHWNAQGHHVAAELIARRLCSEAP